MHRGLFTALVLLSLTHCASTDPSSQVEQPARRGSLTVEIEPNPIVARTLPSGSFEFPFEIVVREVSGVPVTVTEVSLEVVAFGALTVHSERFGPEEIRRRGFPTEVPAGGELRYRFQPRRKVDDDRLFGGVSAEVTIRGTSQGTEIEPARTSVTVTRGG